MWLSWCFTGCIRLAWYCGKMYSRYLRFMIKKTMFGVGALGVSVVVGYGFYRCVQGRQKTRKIKEAVDEMVWPQNVHHLESLQVWLCYSDPCT